MKAISEEDVQKAVDWLRDNEPVCHFKISKFKDVKMKEEISV